ncbi:MAG: VOC family protein, partial [Clostridium celatum]|nr:VOC family protein [Clostridium celatum]
MKINKIHHVAVICSNYQVSKKFYTEILGLKVIREVYREERESYKLDLEIGDSQIELFSFKNAPERV